MKAIHAAGGRLGRIWLIPIAALVFAGIANARNTAIINVNTFTSDDRQIVSDGDISRPPFNSVLQLYNGTGGICSAPIIEDLRIVVVPLHCVYSNGKLSTPVRLYYESTRGNAKLTFTAKIVKPERKDLRKLPRNFYGDDWALLIINQNPPHDARPFKLLPPGAIDPCGGNVQIIGYSQDINKGRDLVRDPSCQLHPELNGQLPGGGSNVVAHDCNVTKIGSGSPLFCSRDGDYIMVASHDAEMLRAGKPQLNVPFSAGTRNIAIKTAGFYQAVMELKAELESGKPSGPLLREAEQPKAPTKTVHYASLNSDLVEVRSAADAASPIRFTYQRNGLPVEIIAEHNQWRMIRDWQGSEGWVDARSLGSERTVIVTAAQALLHADADTGSKPLAKLNSGVIARVLECKDQWCEVEPIGPAQSIRGWLAQDEVWGVSANEVVNSR